jgi:hypothetical protein
MNNQKARSGNWAANSERNTVLLGYWTAAWVLTMAIANFGPRFIWQSIESITIFAILLNIAIGFGMIMANKRHLRGLDEMHQKIQLEAMGMSLGIGLIVGLGYSNLDVTDIIGFDAEISHVVILMGITYGLSVIFGLRKFR